MDALLDSGLYCEGRNTNTCGSLGASPPISQKFIPLSIMYYVLALAILINMEHPVARIPDIHKGTQRLWLSPSTKQWPAALRTLVVFGDASFGQCRNHWSRHHLVTIAPASDVITADVTVFYSSGGTQCTSASALSAGSGPSYRDT